MNRKKTIGVVGAGSMGAGVAQKFAQEGFNVIMQDITEELVEKGFITIRAMLEQGIKKNVFTLKKMEETMGRIKGGTDFNALADADLMVEVLPEDMALKKTILTQLDKICSFKTIFATNTSIFNVKDLAKTTHRPDRFIGMHYLFHPVKNRLLEVIPHKGTSQETRDKIMEISRLHGKIVILTQDSPGFAVNRFFLPLLTESVKLVEEGIGTIPTVEQAAKEIFKIDMGPFQLMNTIGIPLAVHASTTLGRKLGKFYDTPTLLKQQMDSGSNWRLEGSAVDQSCFEIVRDRLLGACLGAAAALVSEGVASIENTYIAAKVGLRWFKGPFEIMNQIGIDKAYIMIKSISDNNPDFKMPKMMKKKRTLKQPFNYKSASNTVQGGIAKLTFNLPKPEPMNTFNTMPMDQFIQKRTAYEM